MQYSGHIGQNTENSNDYRNTSNEPILAPEWIMKLELAYISNFFQTQLNSFLHLVYLQTKSRCIVGKTCLDARFLCGHFHHLYIVLLKPY